MANVSISNATFILLKTSDLNDFKQSNFDVENRGLERIIPTSDSIRHVTPLAPGRSRRLAWRRHMTLQEQYDDAMFDFSRGEFDHAIVKLKAVLAHDATNYEAQLALGMAYYRKEDFKSAITEGHKAEQLRPKEQLVHTNLSLFYMKSGDKVTAEKHGLQARIAGWREDAAKEKNPENKEDAAPELQMAGAKPAAVKLPTKFPDQPWKKKT